MIKARIMSDMQCRHDDAIQSSERWRSPGRDEWLSIANTPDFAARVYRFVQGDCAILGNMR